MTTGFILEQAAAFWSRAGRPVPYPRDLDEPIAVALPLAVTRLPRLWLRDAEAYLARAQLPVPGGEPDRPLHGCLFALGGQGWVMLDGAAPPEERRFTLAHETAHFICDYLVPRARAVERIGPAITEALDGMRPPAVAERAAAALAGAPIGLHMHLMARREHGPIGCQEIEGAETRADQLALELLAPAGEVERRLRVAGPPRSHRDRVKLAEGVLMRDFGLPPVIAAGYAEPLCRAAFGGRSFRDWLAG